MGCGRPRPKPSRPLPPCSALTGLRRNRNDWPDSGRRAAAGALSSPTHQRRKTHQVRFRIRIRAEAELGAPVIDEIEFDITSPLQQQLVTGLVIERGVL